MAAILFVSPKPEDADRITKILSPLNLPVEHVANMRDARKMLAQDTRFDVILTEKTLPDGKWTDILNVARRVSPDSEVIVTDRLADARLWAEALNLGAYDLLPQPFYEAEVLRILGNACSRRTAEHYLSAC